MIKSVELCQKVARGIVCTTWTVPLIRDGSNWRNIKNTHIVMNKEHLNGHDYYEDAIFRAESIMKALGWKTEITDTKQRCHEHLHYQHYKLTCWK